MKTIGQKQLGTNQDYRGAVIIVRIKREREAILLIALFRTLAQNLRIAMFQKAIQKKLLAQNLQQYVFAMQTRIPNAERYLDNL